MKINRIKKLLVSVLVCSMAFGNISYIPTMAKENVQNYGLNNPTTDSSGVSTWDCIYFGNYWQNDTNGDGVADENDAKQPIKWHVLSVNGDNAFVIADQNLDAKAYNETKTDVTWENSTIRSWLNGYGASANKAAIGIEVLYTETPGITDGIMQEFELILHSRPELLHMDSTFRKM